MKLLADLADIGAMFCFTMGTLLAYEKSTRKEKWSAFVVRLVLRSLLGAWSGGGLRDVLLSLLCGRLIQFAIMSAPACWGGYILGVLTFFVSRKLGKQKWLHSVHTNWVISVGDGIGSGLYLASGGAKAINYGLSTRTALLAGFLSAAGATIVNQMLSIEPRRLQRLIKKVVPLSLWLFSASIFSRLVATEDQTILRIVFAGFGGANAIISMAMVFGEETQHIRYRTCDSFKIGLCESEGHRFHRIQKLKICRKILCIHSALRGSGECLTCIATA